MSGWKSVDYVLKPMTRSFGRNFTTTSGHLWPRKCAYLCRIPSSYGLCIKLMIILDYELSDRFIAKQCHGYILFIVNIFFPRKKIVSPSFVFDFRITSNPNLSSTLLGGQSDRISSEKECRLTKDPEKCCQK